ncbi:hypothetical protein F5148DRAFT_698473 [Russula earlei]|uniref:Uncharacterized protein n=1 Tax=Russula earlei TaxID=71964 RepID=A0ACC0TTR3_9AGAM|nr:hypothetical protein F5148DRAFT_698473 [Russula earlei]
MWPPQVNSSCVLGREPLSSTSRCLGYAIVILRGPSGRFVNSISRTLHFPAHSTPNKSTPHESCHYQQHRALVPFRATLEDQISVWSILRAIFNPCLTSTRFRTALSQTSTGTPRIFSEICPLAMPAALLPQSMTSTQRRPPLPPTLSDIQVNSTTWKPTFFLLGRCQRHLGHILPFCNDSWVELPPTPSQPLSVQHGSQGNLGLRPPLCRLTRPGRSSSVNPLGH